MRLHIFSDIHCDVSDDWSPPRLAGVDAVIVAGDVREGLDSAMRWLRQRLDPDVAIVLVAGNHEYFARSRPEERLLGRGAAAAHGVAFLDDTSAVIGGVRFVGATLWTNYELYGADRRDEMMAIARRSMMDHRRILEQPGCFISPEDELELHRSSIAFIAATLAEPFAGPTVVVTHHGPHPLSLADRYRDDPISAAFISDLSPLISQFQPALWVHGHTHVSFDYRVGATRIVCNPHGYGSENPEFDPELMVEV